MYDVKTIETMLIENRLDELRDDEKILIDENVLKEMFNEEMFETFHNEINRQHRIDLYDHDYFVLIVSLIIRNNLKLLNTNQKHYDRYVQYLSHMMDFNSNLMKHFNEDQFVELLSIANKTIYHHVYEHAFINNIDLTPYIKDVILKFSFTRYCSSINENFMKFILDNLTKEDVNYEMFRNHIDKDVFFQRLIELNFTLSNNQGDLFLQYCFDKNNKVDVEFYQKISVTFSYQLSGFKLNKDLIYRCNPYKFNGKIIYFLSTLENFDDFININKTLLLKIMDDECVKFIERYV